VFQKSAGDSSCVNSGCLLLPARPRLPAPCGRAQVVNVDISPVVINQMRAMDQLPGQRWEVADCRAMPQYGDASFGSVLDKGTLDAVLCSSSGPADAAAYMDEVIRLLSPGGVFLLISLGQPAARLAALRATPPGDGADPLPYLSHLLQKRMADAASAAAAAAARAASAAAVPASAAAAADGVPAGSSGADSRHTSSGGAPPPPWRWQSVEVFLLPKPTLYLQSESSLTGKPIQSGGAELTQTDKDAPVHWLGPYRPGADLDAAIKEQGLDLRGFFTAFACTKPQPAASQQQQGHGG
jgi:SAM-dependent methyltransferase